jgi:hypothetical protein
MYDGRIAKKIIESKVAGGRKRGRSRWRWLEDVEKDVQEMRVKRWLRKAVDRKEWPSVIKEARAV